MGAAVFGNEFFDQWLHQKSNEILAKVEKEKISNEDMLILSLKAQVNHFHHMDIEFREEFKKINGRFGEVQGQFEKIDKRFEQVERRFEQVDQRFEQVDQRFEQVDQRFEQVNKRFEQVDKRFEQVDKRFEQVNNRFEQVDKRFDYQTRVLMWGFGMMVTMMSGILLKLSF